MPETCEPAACARVSGAASVILAPPLPPLAETTTAVSWFTPLSMVMVWPAVKPVELATAITVAPTSMATPAVVAPPVPTIAMTAVSRLAPVSIVIVWPAAKLATLATLRLISRTDRRTGRQGGGGLYQEIVTETPGICAIRKAAHTSVG